MISMRPWLFVMQKNASDPAVARTMEDMSQKLIQSIFWPANLPDLNPIEAVLGQDEEPYPASSSESGLRKAANSR